MSDTVFSEYMTEAELAAEARVTTRTLWRWRTLGEGPPFTRIGRRILYRRTAIKAWLASHERVPA